MYKGEIESGIICLQPFYFMEFASTGKVFTCCPAWIKEDIGNMRNKTIAELWNAEWVKFIREKMYEGQWEDICNPICPKISRYLKRKKTIHFNDLYGNPLLNSKLAEEIKSRKIHLESGPTVFNFSNSNICNLSCIMCNRKDFDEDRELMMKTAHDVEEYLFDARRIILSGHGDPFVRPDTRHLLINYKGENPHLKFNLITNGLLLPKYWEQIKHQRFGTMTVSVDASDKETYEKIRVGGSWKDILRSLSLVKENENRFESIALNMTVMRANYKKIPDFITFAESYKFRAGFQRIRGAFGDQNFFEMKDTPALEELRKIILIEQSKKRDIPVHWGDLTLLMQDIDKEKEQVL